MLPMMPCWANCGPNKKPTSEDMAWEIEALGYLAHKRDIIFASKKNTLRKEIEMLKGLLMAVQKDRELLHGQIHAAHVLCGKRLAKAEKELQETQSRLQDTKNEAASLLESSQHEMDNLQKGRDDAEAQCQQLHIECSLLKEYAKHLEHKVCVLVMKLEEYHMHLQKKSEEVVETRGCAVVELEWVKQSMLKFEKNLQELHNLNAQVSLFFSQFRCCFNKSGMFK